MAATTLINREQFTQAVDDTGRDIDVREDYSGRAMYGSECLAVVCDIDDFALLCACLGSFADEWDFVGTTRQDGMGLGTVYYWPGVQLAPKDD